MYDATSETRAEIIVRRRGVAVEPVGKNENKCIASKPLPCLLQTERIISGGMYGWSDE